MTTQQDTNRNTWSPIIASLDEEELSCVVNLALTRLGTDFGKPYALTLNPNPSNTTPVPLSHPSAVPATAPARSRFVGKRWLRVVDKIDLTVKGGFSILGSYTHATRIGQVPDGSLIVVCERQQGNLRVAVVKKNVMTKTVDVFGDGSFYLDGCSFVARSDGTARNTHSMAVPGYHTGLDAQTPTQFHGTPWATIIAVLKLLNVPIA